MIILFFFATSFLAIFGLVGYLISAPKYSGPVSDHFDGKKFYNLRGVKANGGLKALKWMMGRKLGPWKEITDMPFGPKPVDQVVEGIRVTFVNHSTFLIQVDGLNILTDPIWSKRTSPVEWAGPKRMRPPGIRLEDLPKIDVLLLSHNHWDHLDMATVKEIYKHHHPVILTPLGVKAFLDREGVAGALDLNWWEERELQESIMVQSVPAQHFSGRGLFDRDATLWCGYVIRRPGGNIYFVGDTGYHEQAFKEIGERCAPIELALVPIGAFKPEWFMSPIHCSPAEAVKLHQDVGARTSIATHFGTFPLADDGQHEPIERLQEALRLAGIDSTSFAVLTEGVSYVFPQRS